MQTALVRALFETDAIRLCPPQKPFWYTSGTIGPYYINTHFLYGSEEEANGLLKLIDESSADKDGCSKKVHDAVMAQYEGNPVFRMTIDALLSVIREKINLDEVDLISGGERRDWFFSLPAAALLKKPHLTIFKDGACRLFDGERSLPAKALDGKRVLHIADLVTEASSYVRAWIPAVEKLFAKMLWSAAIVDRNQGGAKVIADKGVAFYSLVEVGDAFFDLAEETGHLDQTLRSMLEAFVSDPHESMRAFLKEHPEFLKESLASDPKTAGRARICVEQDLYGLEKG